MYNMNSVINVGHRVCLDTEKLHMTLHIKHKKSKASYLCLN